MKERKGMSPLIAAVILIAATMVIAAILASWTAQFTEQKLRQAEEESITGGARCLGAQFELYSGGLDGTTLQLVLNNKKSIDLYLTDLFLIGSNNTVDNVSLDVTLKGNEIMQIERAIPNANFLTGEIKTQCPDVSVFFTRDQVA